MDNYLPDKLTLNLKNIKSLVNELATILKYHMTQIETLSAYTELGNDLNYSLKEIKNFRPKLKSFLEAEGKKTPVDLLGNNFRTFSTYKYIEFLFSEDYRKITSIRLVGRVRRGSRSRTVRYVFFNLENIFDINVINILYNADEIKRTHQLYSERLVGNIDTSFTISPELISVNSVQIDVSAREEISRIGSLEFLNRYFIPIPQLYKKPSSFQTNSAVLDSIISDVTPKDWTQLVEQNEKFGLLDTKEQVYLIESTISPFRSDSLVSNLARKGEQIRANSNNSGDPLDCIIYLWNSFFNTYDLCYITQDIAKQLIPDPAQFIMNMSVIDMFTAIDALPPPIADAIYMAFEGDGISLTGALNRIQLFIDSNSTGFETNKKTCKKLELVYEPSSKTMRMKNLFRELKQQYPDLYGDIEKEFNQNFSREIVINILREFIDLIKMINFCNFRLPRFSLPSFEIRDLFGEFSFDIRNFLLNLICGLLSELMDILVNLLFSLGKVDDFLVEIFMSDNEQGSADKWSEYVSYATFLLFQSNAATTKPQTPVDQEFVSSLLRSNSTNLMRSISLYRQASTGNLVEQANGQKRIIDICEITPINVPNIQSSQLSQEMAMQEAEDEERLKDATSAFTDLAEADATTILRRISKFNYCINSDFFTTSGIKDERAVDVLRYIASQLDNQQQNPLQTLTNDQISDSLKNMIRQVQAVLSQKELMQLITGSYDDITAEIVRVIGKINFPSLTDKVDPVKYFTMLGKVMGNLNNLKKSGAIA